MAVCRAIEGLVGSLFPFGLYAMARLPSMDLLEVRLALFGVGYQGGKGYPVWITFCPFGGLSRPP
eukprot:6577062-Heterocapsa_arctica.AAC.1